MPKPAIKSKSPPASASALETTRTRIRAWLLALILVLLTMVVYWPATSHDFLNYDDNLVVTSNIHVQNGLTLENAKWAFFNPVNSMWHPLTVMSQMLDCQIYGLNPWGHHLTNVLLHALNAALVFVLLWQLSGATSRSFLVAALFAVHPLHVESVAWVAERKDVLSAFFGLLTLIFYTRYAQRKIVNRQSSIANYALALFFFALGLMSKPMLVTWPFVMLLLDYWPLGRLRTPDFGLRTSRSVLSLILEKLPFFALAAVASYVTFVVQKQTGALGAGETIPLAARVGNALISYCRYLGKLFWPTDLAVFYPHPGYWPLAQVLLAGLLLVVVSVLFFVKRQQYPYFLMGWLWFCGMLVPVIGMVQTGGHAMADRYTYIPSLGVLILVIWGVEEVTRHWRHRTIALSLVGLMAIVLCLALMRVQLGYWQDSETLFRHALSVTENNYLAHNNLGVALDQQGQTAEATRQYREAIRLKPDYAEAQNNLGVVLDQPGQLDEAISRYREAIRLKPDYANAHNNLGFALERKGQIDEAISQYQEAIRLKPDHPKAHNNLGRALAAKGQFDEAIDNFRAAIQINPSDAEVLQNLGVALAASGRPDEAVENFRKAIQINPNLSETFFHLGMTLDRLGRTREAIDSYRAALKLNPDLVGVLNNLAWALATSPDDQLRNGTEAVRLAERACELTHQAQPFFIGTLAAAYAEAGRFPEAVATAEKAEQLATHARLATVAAKNRQLLELYQSGKPYHEPVPAGP